MHQYHQRWHLAIERSPPWSRRSSRLNIHCILLQCLLDELLCREFCPRARESRTHARRVRLVFDGRRVEVGKPLVHQIGTPSSRNIMSRCPSLQTKGHTHRRSCECIVESGCQRRPKSEVLPCQASPPHHWQQARLRSPSPLCRVLGKPSD
jgi:hypothetical protein